MQSQKCYQAIDTDETDCFSDEDGAEGTGLPRKGSVPREQVITCIYDVERGLKHEV
jgi:hypothetical protein